MCESVNDFTLMNEGLSVVSVFKFLESYKFSFTIMSVASIPVNKADFLKQVFHVG